VTRRKNISSLGLRLPIAARLDGLDGATFSHGAKREFLCFLLRRYDTDDVSLQVPVRLPGALEFIV
jgi:hypothetical protein